MENILNIGGAIVIIIILRRVVFTINYVRGEFTIHILVDAV